MNTEKLIPQKIRAKASKFVEMLEDVHKVMIVGHFNPDGAAVAILAVAISRYEIAVGGCGADFRACIGMQ